MFKRPPTFDASPPLSEGDPDDFQEHDNNDDLEEPTVEEYKAALEHFKMEYETVQMKLAEKELQLENLLKNGSSSPPSNNIKSFESQNQVFQLRSKINELQFNHLEEKEQMIRDGEREREEMEELVRESNREREEMELQYQTKIKDLLATHDKQFKELADEIVSQNKEDLVKELEQKSVQFLEEIQNLEKTTSELEQENVRLSDRIRQLQEVEQSKMDGKEEVNRSVEASTLEMQRLRREMSSLQDKLRLAGEALQTEKEKSALLETKVANLNSRVKVLQTESQNSELILSDKVTHLSQEVQRTKKFSETYKTMGVEKDAEIRKLKEKLLTIEGEVATKTEELRFKVEEQTVKAREEQQLREAKREREEVSINQLAKLKKVNQRLAGELQHLKEELEEVQKEVLILRKDNLAVKRDNQKTKRDLVSAEQKLEEISFHNKDFESNYNRILKQKHQLLQDKNNEIKRIQEELEKVLQQPDKKEEPAQRIEKVEETKVQNGVEQPEEITQLRQQLRIAEGKTKQTEDRLKQVEDEKSLLENKFQIMKMQGGGIDKKKPPTTPVDDRKLTTELQNLRQKEQSLRESYALLMEQHRQLKENNTKQMEELQETLKQMDEAIIADKKEYEIKNSLKFQEETSVYNQLNVANNLLAEEKNKASTERDIFLAERTNLEDSVLALTKRVKELESQVLNLEEARLNQREDTLSQVPRLSLKKRLTTLSEQIDELRNGEKYDQQRVHNTKDMQYLLELEQKCRAFQETNMRLIEYSSSKIPTNDPTEKMAGRRPDYTYILNTNKKIDLRSRPPLNRPHTHNEFSPSNQPHSQLDSVYRQVEILNNIIMKKDSEIGSLRQKGEKESGRWYQPPREKPRSSNPLLSRKPSDGPLVWSSHSHHALESHGHPLQEPFRMQL